MPYVVWSELVAVLRTSRLYSGSIVCNLSHTGRRQ
jgi:hypothetical protein